MFGYLTDNARSTYIRQEISKTNTIKSHHLTVTLDNEKTKTQQKHLAENKNNEEEHRPKGNGSQIYKAVVHSLKREVNCSQTD